MRTTSKGGLIVDGAWSKHLEIPLAARKEENATSLTAGTNGRRASWHENWSHFREGVPKRTKDKPPRFRLIFFSLCLPQSSKHKRERDLESTMGMMRLRWMWYHHHLAVLLAVLASTKVSAWQTLPTPTRALPLYATNTPNHGDDDFQQSRRMVLWYTTAATVGLLVPSAPAIAFDGGVGGLGKTKPETGVFFVDPDVAPATQTASGLVTAELVLDRSAGDVALVSFESPWPLLRTAAGLEARDLSTSDAAFCQVITGKTLSRTASPAQQAAALQEILTDSVLGKQGKFGAYGLPSGIQVKAVSLSSSSDSANGTTSNIPPMFQLSFTALTPGMRESERRYYVAVQSIRNTLVLLLVGTTENRFAREKDVLRAVAQSWQVVPAPPKASRG